MMSSCRSALVLGALLALPTMTWADPPDQDKGAKAEEPEAAVSRVGRAFGQLRGYQVAATCQGGLAQGADHRIGTSTVNESWQATVAGTVCRVDAPQAFRLRTGQGGAVQSGGRWMSLLASDEGRRLERLFVRPEAVVAECVRLKRLARWVEPEATGQGQAPAAPVAARADADDGGTQARGQGSDDSSAEVPPAPVSNHLRIVGPTTTALEHFTRIINSGCFAEG